MDIRSIVTRWTLEGMGQGRLELADELIAPDYVYHERGREDRRAGPAGQRQAIATLHEAFSDFKMAIDDIVIYGDRAAVRDRMMGTQVGSFAGIPPRGKRLDLMRIVVYRVEGGQIHESWAATDLLAMVKQLGSRN